MARTIVIIGAGPGGLTAGMLLARQGFKVEVFEKGPVVGGRNAPLKLDGFTFDTGPTFLMMTRVLEEVFADSGRRLQDYLDLKPIDPFYRLRFDGKTDFFPTLDPERMVAEIERLFPGDGANYMRYRAQEGKKLDLVYPCLQHPYMRWRDFLNPNFLKAIPRLDAFTSVYERLRSYFKYEHMRIAMTFQAKYLGMSPWQCPATFTILSLIEHKYGIYHPIGGLNAISTAMAKCLQEDGGRIHLQQPVQEILVENRRAVGVRLAGGDKVAADAVIINPDFAWAMTHLLRPEHRRKYHDARLAKMEYSCSTFMLYLGLDKIYDLPHHNIIFAQDYEKNVQDIVENGRLSEDPSFYLQNASKLDSTLAPPGQSTLYVLVPVPNRQAPIDWEKEKPRFRELVLRQIESKTELKDLRRHIVVEQVISPLEWEQDYHIYRGATFNLSHKLGQMLIFRPHNALEELDACYLVGGGTHPGSGLPTIYQSGRIAADLIHRRWRRRE